ncbi:hypothetical protein CONLIGDRAFT_394132 [Coniochaeta ligniaria NRRL 30616]|uniref:Uncharacterized protein n=1 Tax=Coniochaeta ligniaria NRRL 30616 TaxID=1408157 RepID=A0A1J7JGJ6_9PEZI|nr:hypothetical protein CONLIGDRAFT_394132 [Coniochaeta ligniaria NRRL 30616]
MDTQARHLKEYKWPRACQPVGLPHKSSHLYISKRLIPPLPSITRINHHKPVRLATSIDSTTSVTRVESTDCNHHAKQPRDSSPNTKPVWQLPNKPSSSQPVSGTETLGQSLLSLPSYYFESAWFPRHHQFLLFVLNFTTFVLRRTSFPVSGRSSLHSSHLEIHLHQAQTSADSTNLAPPPESLGSGLAPEFSTTYRPIAMDGIRLFKDSSLANNNWTTHTIPIVKDDTVIIGVCGISDMEEADPSEDGWFVSDFFAFKHIFTGLGSHQEWHIALKPRQLVEKYQEFVHGSSRRNRKVVLNSRMLDSGAHDLDTITTTSPDDLLPGFLMSVKNELSNSNRGERNLILLVFGHGDLDTKAITIGGRSLEISTLESLIPRNSKVTLITTACYSGGWAASTLLDITTAYAAEMNMPSYSWAASESIGRMGGSVFASSIIKTLADNSEHPQINTTSPTYHHFAKLTAENMQCLHKGIFLRSGLAFSAQDDNWAASWSGLTGVPMADFCRRWEALDDVVSQGDSDLGQSSSSSGQAHRRGSSGQGPRTLLNQLQDGARVQLASCGDFWHMGYGHKERRYLQKLATNTNPTFEEMEGFATWLNHRVTCEIVADRLLRLVYIQPPRGASWILDWDSDKWTPPEDVKVMREVYDQILTVWPRPLRGQGHFWTYPLTYISAAVADHVSDAAEAHMKCKIMTNGCSEVFCRVEDQIANGWTLLEGRKELSPPPSLCVRERAIRRRVAITC